MNAGAVIDAPPRPTIASDSKIWTLGKQELFPVKSARLQLRRYEFGRKWFTPLLQLNLGNWCMKCVAILTGDLKRFSRYLLFQDAFYAILKKILIIFYGTGAFLLRRLGLIWKPKFQLYFQPHDKCEKGNSSRVLGF